VARYRQLNRYCRRAEKIFSPRAAAHAVAIVEHLPRESQSHLDWRGRAVDERAAVEKAAAQFNMPATKLMAVRRR